MLCHVSAAVCSAAHVVLILNSHSQLSCEAQNRQILGAIAGGPMVRIGFAWQWHALRQGLDASTAPAHKMGQTSVDMERSRQLRKLRRRKEHRW